MEPVTESAEIHRVLMPPCSATSTLRIPRADMRPLFLALICAPLPPCLDVGVLVDLYRRTMIVHSTCVEPCLATPVHHPRPLMKSGLKMRDHLGPSSPWYGLHTG